METIVFSFLYTLLCLVGVYVLGRFILPMIEKRLKK